MQRKRLSRHQNWSDSKSSQPRVPMKIILPFWNNYGTFNNWTGRRRPWVKRLNNWVSEISFQRPVNGQHYVINCLYLSLDISSNRLLTSRCSASIWQSTSLEDAKILKTKVQVLLQSKHALWMKGERWKVVKFFHGFLMVSSAFMLHYELFHCHCWWPFDCPAFPDLLRLLKIYTKLSSIRRTNWTYIYSD